MTLSNMFPLVPFTRALLAIIFIMLLCCMFSCSPQKRMYNLVSKNPELLKKDTVIKEVIKFAIDTTKANQSVINASDQLQFIINNLILDLDSCSKQDKNKIASIAKKSKMIFKDRFINDCPEIIKKDTLKYTTVEGHTVLLIPNKENGYDLKLVVNCPKPILKENIKWYNWLLLGFAIGLIVAVILKH